MRLLMIGDIVGRSGRRAIKDNLSELKREFDLDLIIANGENAAGGSGSQRTLLGNCFLQGGRSDHGQPRLEYQRGLRIHKP